jgi:hypothetical protein
MAPPDPFDAIASPACAVLGSLSSSAPCDVMSRRIPPSSKVRGFRSRTVLIRLEVPSQAELNSAPIDFHAGTDEATIELRELGEAHTRGRAKRWGWKTRAAGSSRAPDSDNRSRWEGGEADRDYPRELLALADARTSIAPRSSSRAKRPSPGAAGHDPVALGSLGESVAINLPLSIEKTWKARSGRLNAGG